MGHPGKTPGTMGGTQRGLGWCPEATDGQIKEIIRDQKAGIVLEEGICVAYGQVLFDFLALLKKSTPCMAWSNPCA